MRQVITPTKSGSNSSSSSPLKMTATPSPSPPSSKTLAEKRAEELEALRQRALAKGQAARLQDAEAPTSEMMLNFQEAQRQKAKMEKDKLRDAKAYLNHYRGDDQAVLRERESRRIEIERERQNIQQAKEWLQRPSYTPTSSQTPPSLSPTKGSNGKPAKDVRSSFFHSEHVEGKEFTSDVSEETTMDMTVIKQKFDTGNKQQPQWTLPSLNLKKDGTSTPSTVNTSLDYTSLAGSVDDLDLFGDELAQIRSKLECMEYHRPKSLSLLLREIETNMDSKAVNDDDESEIRKDWVIVDDEVEDQPVDSPVRAKEQTNQEYTENAKIAEAEIPAELLTNIVKEEDKPKESILDEMMSKGNREFEVSSTIVTEEPTSEIVEQEYCPESTYDEEVNISDSNSVVESSAVESAQSRLIVLFSSATVVKQQRTHQDRAQTILTGKGLWTRNGEDSNNCVELVDGCDPAQKDRRSLLFGISGLRGKYPQFFLDSSGTDDSIKFLGDYEWLEDQNEMGLLSKIELFGASDHDRISPGRRKHGGLGHTAKLDIKTMIMLSLGIVLVLLNVVHATEYTAQDSASWAISSDKLSSVLGSDKQKLYDDFIAGCNIAKNTTADSNVCRDNDNFRIRMNRDQPASVYNYTVKGYEKIRAPEELFSIIKEFWEANRHKAEIEWKDINVYHNAWEAPPTIVHLNQQRMGGSVELQNKIWNLAKPILEEWTGQYLTGVSLYGIRLYHNNSILTPHVDRMPLVTSAIIQVDQDVDEPWPLEVYGHDGVATNITMEPGDMVLYESHSVIHGRPFPMRGNFYANCFIHFEPVAPINGQSTYDPELDIPPYLLPGSLWEKEWRRDNKGWKKTSQDDAVKFARVGNLEGLKEMSRYMPDVIHKADANGWTVLHESCRAGHLDIVQFLIVEKSIDVDLLTKTGVSPLNIVMEFQGPKHAVTLWLESQGATEIHPHKKKRPIARPKTPSSMPSSSQKSLNSGEL